MIVVIAAAWFIGAVPTFLFNMSIHVDASKLTVAAMLRRAILWPFYLITVVASFDEGLK